MKALRIPIFSLLLVWVATGEVHGSASEFDDELFDVALKPNEALIQVTIVDKKGKPLSGVVLQVEQGLTRKTFTRVSDKDGTVLLVVPVRATYHLRFLSIGKATSNHVERFDIGAEPEQRHTLTMTYDGSGAREFTLEGVQFNTDTAVLKSSSHRTLDQLVAYMDLRPEIYIELSGHTDNQGDPEKNMLLSDDRAAAVKAYLVSRGIDPRRITTTGLGDTRPVASNATAKGRSQNRRTEVRVIE